MIEAIAIKEPDRPIPAEQWTTTGPLTEEEDTATVRFFERKERIELIL